MLTVKYIILLFFILFTLTSCNDTTDIAYNKPIADFSCEFVLTGDYYNEESNVILAGTSINVAVNSNYNIDGLIVNDNYYNNINNQISLLVRTEDFYNLTISNIIINDIYYNVAFNKTIKVIDPFAILTINPLLTTDAHSINIDLNCYKDLDFPIYMSILNNNDYLFEGNITDYNYYYDNIQSGLFNIKIYADLNQQYLMYTKDLYFYPPVNILVNYEVGYDILTFTYNSGVILDSFIMDGKTYELVDSKLTIEKPVGLTLDYTGVLRYYYNGKLFTHEFSLNFLETKVPNYEVACDFNSVTDVYNISFSNLDVYDRQKYEILLYDEKDILVASSDTTSLEFSKYNSNSTYRAVLNLTYFDTISMTEKKMSRELTFTTGDRYENYLVYNLTLDQNKGLIYFGWLDNAFIITDINLYYDDNLIYKGTDLVINTCGEGNYKIEITYETDEYGKKYQQTKTEYMYISYTRPNLILSTNSTEDSITYDIIDQSNCSKIVDFNVYLFSLGELIATSNSFNDTFTNLKPNTAYEIRIIYTYYAYNNIAELQDSLIVYTKESLYGR